MSDEKKTQVQVDDLEEVLTEEELDKLVAGSSGRLRKTFRVRRSQLDMLKNAFSPDLNFAAPGCSATPTGPALLSVRAGGNCQHGHERKAESQSPQHRLSPVQRK